MNNGEGNSGKLNARDFTAEIEAATNFELSSRPEVSARELGGKVLATPGEKPGAIFGAAETVADRTEIIGEETQLQVDERLHDDAEDAASEEIGGLEHKIVAKNQEGVARAMIPEIDKIVDQKVYRPADLERAYRHGVNATLAVFNRKIGDRN